MKKSIDATDPRNPVARESQGKLTGTLTEGKKSRLGEGKKHVKGGMSKSSACSPREV